MSTDANKDLVRRWWDALNEGRAVDAVDEFYSADYVLHDPSQPEPVHGLDGVRAFVAGVMEGFPDVKVTAEQLLAEGDTVSQLATARGTHQGNFQGIPATGKQVEIWLMVISRIADGKIAEEWQLVDSLAMLQQMGVIPAPE